MQENAVYFHSELLRKELVDDNTLVYMKLAVKSPLCASWPHLLTCLLVAACIWAASPQCGPSVMTVLSHLHPWF